MTDVAKLTFPTLMWQKDTGQEATAHTLAEHTDLAGKGFLDTPPGSLQRTTPEPAPVKPEPVIHESAGRGKRKEYDGD
jgi:hypothetical protein